MKKYLPTILFITAVVFSVILADSLLRIKSQDGIKQAQYMYAQPKDTVEVAFMGSSHMHCDVNTATLWENYGIASYDYSAAEQPLWITYYYLKELLKRQSPSLLVIDMFSPARIKDDYKYRWMKDNLYGVRFSKNKLDMINTAVEKDMIPTVFPSFFGYHSRFDELGWDDVKSLFITKAQKRSFKGYTPYFENRTQKPPCIKDGEVVLNPQVDNLYFEEKDRGVGLTEKSKEYLLKIIELAQKEDISLLFIAAPYTENYYDRIAYKEIEEIAADYGIEFIDYNLIYEEMNIDYSTDFNDFSHLNYAGSVKFTERLGEDLKERFSLSDHRQDKKYSSWDDNAAAIRKASVENPIVTVIE